MTMRLTPDQATKLRHAMEDQNVAREKFIADVRNSAFAEAHRLRVRTVCERCGGALTWAEVGWAHEASGSALCDHGMTTAKLVDAFRCVV